MMHNGTIDFRSRPAAAVRRPRAGVLVVLAAALLLVGCGTSESGGAGVSLHRLPGYDVSLELPATWDTVGSASPEAEIDAFQSDHPQFIEIAQLLRFSTNDATFAAAEGKGDPRLLVSVNEVGPDVTLKRHIETNLASLEDGAPADLKVRVDGPRREVVDLAGGDAWRLRWSFDGDLGRIRLVQYTVVRDGLLAIFTYSTTAPWEESGGVFETSARSIRFDAAGDAPAPTAAGLIAFQRDGQDDASDIYTVPAADGKERRLTRSGKEGSPAWSPDGTRIAFVSARDGNAEVYVMREDGSGQTRLTVRPGPDSSPSWSPDGKRLMFTSGDCDPACDLFVMNADGSGVEQLTDDGESADGSWSPDGTRIVFWSGRDHGSAIFVMDADGRGARKLTGRFDTAWGADWSPDGRTILFAGTEADDADETQAIYRMSADGDDVQRVAPARGNWIDEPEWSPDGGSIAFFSDAQGPGAIWVMSADGSGQRPLTHGGDSHAPNWRP